MRPEEEASGPVRLWIDTDIGTNVDDAVALLAAVAHPAVELVGVSTVGSDPERRAAVAVGLLAAAGVDLGSVVVAAGAEAAVAGVASSGAEALLAIGPLANVAAVTAAGVRPGGRRHPSVAPWTRPRAARPQGRAAHFQSPSGAR